MFALARRSDAQVRRALLVLASIAAASAAAAPAPAHADAVIPIFDCATTVPPGRRAALAADVLCEARCSTDLALACGADGATCPEGGTCLRDTLHLGLGARLSMAGHRLTMEHRAVGIYCADETFPDPPASGRCVVEGPGAIVGATGGSVGIESRVDLLVRNLDVDGARMNGRRVLADDVRFVPFKESTITGGWARLRRMTVGSSGVIANQILIEDVALADHSGGLHTIEGDIRGRDITTVGAAVFTADEGEIALRRLRMKATQESSYLRAQRVHLVDSVVTSVRTEERPTLVRSRCQTSIRTGIFVPPYTWGVCEQDPVARTPVPLPVPPQPRSR